jgi:hypothetical protein
MLLGQQLQALFRRADARTVTAKARPANQD